MDGGNAISVWLQGAKHGDAEAAGRIFHQYFAEVVAIGRHFLRHVSKRGCDEYDAANSVFRTFWRRVKTGRFPELDNREGLWRLLVVITVRKSLKQARKEALRRPVDKSAAVLADTPSSVLSMELWVALEDTVEQLCRDQQDPLLREVLMLKIEGFTVQEIAQSIGRSKPTVERKLRLIRNVLAEEFLD